MTRRLTTTIAGPVARLMDHMRFPHKLLALGGALALGWIVLLAMLVPRLLNEQHLVERERSGVDGIVALGDFMDAVQDHRRAIRLFSKGDRKAADQLPDIARAANDASARLDAWMEGPGAGMGLASRWAGLRSPWRALEAQGINGDLADAIDRHNQLTGQATALMTAVSDQSGLTLDPVLSTTFLVDALARIAPIGVELTIVRGTGWGILIDGGTDDATRTNLIRRSALLKSLMDRIAADVEKASTLDPAIRIAQEPARSSAESVKQILQSLDQDILAPPIRSEKAPGFRRLCDSAWQSLGELRRATAGELTRALSLRAAKARHQTQFTAAACAVAALITALVFMGFVQSLNRSLQGISMNARRLARGDFPERIEIPARDEMGEIASELDAVSHSLKAMTEGLQQALALQSAIVDSSNLGMIVTDPSGLIVSFNRAAQRMLGYGEHEVIGSKRLDFFHDPAELALHAQTLSQQLGYAVPVGFETLVAKSRTMPEEVDEQEWSYVRRDGTRLPVLLPVTAFRNFEGSITGFLAVAHDISERKQKDLAIARSLREKETLLKEVYHRVKNNLQVISSLFDLQLRTLPEGPVNAALRDGASRVSAMALVHEKLYQSGTLSSISLKNYVEDFCERMSAASSTRERGINLITEVAPVEVSMDTAVPLGLWINEVISNSLKHGFPDGRPGTIRVKLECEEGPQVTVTIADDGIGIATDAPRKTKSLGMKLVAALSEQLDGHYSIESNVGVTTRLTFPLPTA